MPSHTPISKAHQATAPDMAKSPLLAELVDIANAWSSPKSEVKSRCKGLLSVSEAMEAADFAKHFAKALPDAEMDVVQRLADPNATLNTYVLPSGISQVFVEMLKSTRIICPTRGQPASNPSEFVITPLGRDVAGHLPAERAKALASRAPSSTATDTAKYNSFADIANKWGAFQSEVENQRKELLSAYEKAEAEELAECFAKYHAPENYQERDVLQKLANSNMMINLSSLQMSTALGKEPDFRSLPLDMRNVSAEFWTMMKATGIIHPTIGSAFFAPYEFVISPLGRAVADYLFPKEKKQGKPSARTMKSKVPRRTEQGALQ